MGIIGKLKEKLDGNKRSDEEPIRRLGSYKPKDEPVTDKVEEFVPRYKQAKEWRDEQADKLPLIERSKFKKRL